MPSIVSLVHLVIHRSPQLRFLGFLQVIVFRYFVYLSDLFSDFLFFFNVSFEADSLDIASMKIHSTKTFKRVFSNCKEIWLIFQAYAVIEENKN